MNIFPPLKPILLANAAPGSLVLYQGRPSIVVVDPKDSVGINFLAVFDGKQFDPTSRGQFNFGDNVLSVGGTVVIEPIIEGGIELRKATHQDTSTLFIDDRTAYATLNMGPVPQFYRLFNLSTGQIMQPNDNRPMAACSAWRLGIRDGDALPDWLISLP